MPQQKVTMSKEIEPSGRPLAPVVTHRDDVAAAPVPAETGTEHQPETLNREKPGHGTKTAAPVNHASPTAVQDVFLNSLRRENIDVVLYFCDGSQERGTVRAFDTFTILLENRSSGKAQLIYKHAIARIFPTRTPAHLPAPEKGRK